ncbi:MAG: hypothetical protein AB3X44_17425 [Leptothrix sp. (in: b-proteobacteria)]
MNLDPTTFALQIINFLVLLWLLTRFLYRPLQAALDARRAAAEQQRADITARQAELTQQAATLQQQRAGFDVERQAAQQALLAEIGVERERRLAQLMRELDDERAKARARDAQLQMREQAQRLQALQQQAAVHVGHYLQRLATPALEAAVIELFLADLAGPQQAAAAAALRNGTLPPGPDDVTAAAGSGDMLHVDLSTAFEPPTALRAQVEAQLQGLLTAQAAKLAWHWQLDSELLAGLRVQVGGHALEASLRRGVDAFVVAEAAA